MLQSCCVENSAGIGELLEFLLCHNGLPRIFRPSADWKKIWLHHPFYLFPFLAIWVTSGDGCMEWIGWRLAGFRWNHIFHAEIGFIQISLVDVGSGHRFIVAIFQCCEVVGVVAPSLLWDMPLRDLKFWRRALDWLRHAWSVECRLRRRFLLTSNGSEDTRLVI